jgi:hypothetical protein
MATVWAPFKDEEVGIWLDRAYSTGWSDTLHFGTLNELIKGMEKRKLRGKVTRLGIVSHGDEPGLVRLDRRMTRATIASFEPELQRLRRYLTPDAMLIFFSCISGKASEGNVFLNALSPRLPGRTVVGFTLDGETQGGLNQTPGLVFVRESRLVAARRGQENLQTPWHVAAKWSRNGAIVRDSPLERQVGNRCANPRCPGHGKPTDRCAGW